MGPGRGAGAADVALVVVTYNSALVVDALLDSVRAAAGALTVRVVVVDNASTDETREVVRLRGDAILVEAENRGFAAGINTGVAAAGEAAAYLALNPDVVLMPGSLEYLVEALGRPGVGITAPQVRTRDGALHHSLRREPTVRRTLGLNRFGMPAFTEYLNDDQSYETPQAVEWALGAALMFSPACNNALGGWDESFFLYSEETDYCLRAFDHGFTTWYDPRAVVMHIGGQSGQSANTHAMQVVNRVRLYRRRHGLLPSWAFFTLTLLREVSWIPRGGEWNGHAAAALLRPSLRPSELASHESIMPS